jgi:glycine/D-amino acid oxidase-like deaminating enzyme
MIEDGSRVTGVVTTSGESLPGDIVLIAAGDSGHGFKFAPVLGDVIADAIEDKPSRFTARFGWRMPVERKAENARWGLS